MTRPDYISHRDHVAEVNTLKEKLAQAEALAVRREQTIVDMQIERDRMKGRTTGKTLDGVIRTETELLIPKRIVQGDHAAYQAWKKRALDMNLRMQIIDDVNPQQTADNMPDTYTEGRNHYVNAAFVRDNPEEYRHQKKYAADNDLRLIVVNAPHQMPSAAFVPKEATE